jgi:hypothetical protein
MYLKLPHYHIVINEGEVEEAYKSNFGFLPHFLYCATLIFTIEKHSHFK